MSFLTSKLFHLIHHTTTISALNRVVLAPALNNSFQLRNYAARKGTRERKRKAKVKVEVQKVGFIPHNLRNREEMLAARVSKKFDDSMKRDPIDDVFTMKFYKWIVYPFVEAVKAHRETHHPEMYNKPNAELYVTFDLNMQGEKKTRFVDNFQRIASIPHKFEHGQDRSIIAFAKNVESQQEASNAGARLSGGVDLIKQVQNGQVLLQDFQHYVAHPDILPELVALRGIMKKKFPNQRAGTLDIDLQEVLNRFLHGINYQARKDEFEKDFGQIDAIIGTLNMHENQLEENFAALIKDIQQQRPKRAGSFITRCILWSPPSKEKFKINHEQYISDGSMSTKIDEGQEVKEENVTL